jgi:hypothetical protein
MGRDRFDYSVMLPPDSSKIEPGLTPVHPITFHWETFTQAADDASMAQRYGGIQFRAGDLVGRTLTMPGMGQTVMKRQIRG